MPVAITSAANYITSGQNWVDGSGNVDLCNNIIFTTTAGINAAGPLFRYFNSTFNFNNNKITIISNATEDLTNSLIRDLSGGTLQNLVLDVSAVTFGFNGGLLVSNSTGFNSYGNVSNIDCSMVNVTMELTNSSLTLCPEFANNRSQNITLSNINLHGTGVNANVNYGYLFTNAFQSYSGTANITNVNNAIDYVSNVGSLLGQAIGRYSSGTINITNCDNTGDISGQYCSGIVGYDAGNLQTTTGLITITNCDNSGAIIGADCAGILGLEANQESSGNIVITDCTNYGDISGSYSAGIVGYNAGYLQTSDGSITITDCDNSGFIIGYRCAGILGLGANNRSSGIIDVSNCTNHSTIIGNYCGGIAGNEINNTSSITSNIAFTNCVNWGDVSGQYSGGIIAGTIIDLEDDSINYLSSGTIDISGCVNHGDINTIYSAGIIGSLAGYQQTSNGSITITNCDNSGAIIGDECAGILGRTANTESSGNIVITDCTNYGNINNSYSAGILGTYANIESFGTIDISGCVNYSDISGNASSGIVGYGAGYLQYSTGLITITNCDNSGAIIGTDCAGILGAHANEESGGTINVFGCTNYGNIIGNESSGIVSKFNGYFQYSTGLITITNCDNSGAIVGNTCAGILGRGANYDSMGTVDVSNCTNHSIITGQQCGGIAGNLINGESDTTSNVTFTNCVNWGDVSGQYSGGIIAGTSVDTGSINYLSEGTIDISGCVNHGRVNTIYSAGIVGPLAGYQQTSTGSITITNCDNSGAIVGNVCAGILGQLSNSGSSGDIIVTECTNHGTISGILSNGVVGYSAGYQQTSNGSITIINCDNSGAINGGSCSGIVGTYANLESSGNILVTLCDNYGDISGSLSAGIVGIGAGNNSTSLGTIDISGCVNYGSISSVTGAGIVGAECGVGTSGTITVRNCTNRGELAKSSVIHADFIDNTTYPFFGNVSNGDYLAAAGIVGITCGYNMDASGHIIIRDCVNYGTFDASYTSGIISFGLGYNSSGAIDVSNCINYADLTINGCSGLTSGLIGINNTGTITFYGCENHGDVSGVALDYDGGCLIGSIGYLNVDGETSGAINIENCINNNSINANEVTLGGIVGKIYLSPTEQMTVTIEGCVNTFTDLSVNDGVVSDIVYRIFDLSSSDETVTQTISILDCSSNAVVNDNTVISKILYSIDAISDDCGTPCNVVISGNSINTNGSVDAGMGVASIMNVGASFNNILANKNVYVSDNIINVNNAGQNLGVMNGYTALSSSLLNIANNVITINDVSNSSNISGILNYFVGLLTSVDINITGNNVTINDIDDNSTGIAGLININTQGDELSSFMLCTDTNLTITGNTITSNTPENLINEVKGNGSIFSVNTDIDPNASPYVGPTGVLTIRDNVLSDNFFDVDKAQTTDYYFPEDFRPYILQLISFPNSNYWFDTTQIELIGQDGEVDIFYPELPVIPPGTLSNDTILRNIFKRALLAINEQKHFEIYPFYHNKVKAKKM